MLWKTAKTAYMLAALFLSLVSTGCSTIYMSTSAPSRIGDITSAFSKDDIRARFGAPEATGRTILGRDTETYRLKLTAGSQMDKRDAVKLLVLCAFPTSWAICAGYLAIDTLLFPLVYKDNEDRKVPIVFVYGEEDRFLYSYNEVMEPLHKYWQAAASLKHPFDDSSEENCPRLVPCIEAYIEETRNRAWEVGYEITDEQQEESEGDIALAHQADGFEITRKQAGELKRARRSDHDLRPAGPPAIEKVSKAQPVI